jgi:hypothetical protein
MMKVRQQQFDRVSALLSSTAQANGPVPARSCRQLCAHLGHQQGASDLPEADVEASASTNRGGGQRPVSGRDVLPPSSWLR